MDIKRRLRSLLAILLLFAPVFATLPRAVSAEQTAAAKAPGERSIVLDKQYLLFPVGTSTGKDSHMTITVDGEKIHDFYIDLGLDKVEWWAHIDVTQWAGKTATLTINNPEKTAAGFERIETSDEPRNLHPLYNERLRPQLRFSQQRGWSNDVEGLIYYDGEYHFFWLGNPFAWTVKNRYWGHAVSKDLIHWQQLPYALRPRAMGNFRLFSKGHCFSGSGNVDVKNTGGWQKGDEKVMVLAYTDTARGECIAISRDRGRTWEPIQENPVIKHKGRDPKLIWYAYVGGDTPLDDRAKKLGGHWVIVVYDEEREHGRNFAFYTSTDLKQWTLQSRLKDYFECPELFELPVDGDPDNTRWVLYDVRANYAVGDFDGRKFTPEHDGRRQVHWPRFVASSCLKRAPDGRVIQIAWAHRIDMHNMPFNQAFTLPGKLWLINTPDGVRMRHWPIKEIDTLREEPLKAEPATVSQDKPLSMPVDGQLFDIVADVDVMDAERIVLQFGETKVVYDVAEQDLDTMDLPLADGRLRLRCIVDRPMYELWGGKGEVHRSNYRRDPGKTIEDIRIYAEGGKAKVEKFIVYPMQSIWKEWHSTQED